MQNLKLLRHSASVAGGIWTVESLRGSASSLLRLTMPKEPPALVVAITCAVLE